MDKRLLLTTILRPLGVNNETCTENIQAEPYNNQITWAQGVFSLRTVCYGWGLDFIAINLNIPTTVLHYPTPRLFIRELEKGYDYVGISFVGCTLPKTIELCQIIRRVSPDAKIILGGYGTVMKECDQYADFVCRGEGVNFLKRLLNEEKVCDYEIPQIRRPLKFLSLKTKDEFIIPIGLGCPRGCDFCSTSHFFDKKYYPLVKTGRKIHEVIHSIKSNGKHFKNISFIDEDFLADKKKILEMASLNSKMIESPILFNSFTSLHSMSQYKINELLSMGLNGAWVGVESCKASYQKLRNINVPQLISKFKNAGITILTSMIIGYDWHDMQAIEEDFEYLLSLKPCLSQFMIYSPCPQTPLYDKMRKAHRLINVPLKYHDGFHLLFKHPHFSPEEIEKVLHNLFQREYEELGPSIFRVLEVQLMGYNFLKNTEDPFLLLRLKEYKRMCFLMYPLLKMGIKKAPSEKVRNFLKELKEKIEGQFNIPISTKSKQYIVPFLYYYTALINRINPRPQPRSLVHHYNS